MTREHYEARASDYIKGRIDGENEVKRQMKIAAQIAFERGYNYRIRIEWIKLFLLVVAGAFTGHLLFNLTGVIITTYL
jgi:hypothetical protein